MRKYIILLVLMLSLSFAVVESGDGGKEFAKNTTEKMCKEPATAAVYLCNGNVVRVVSSNGSTFYKPDGRVVKCPEVAAPVMSAECRILLMPNYCPQKEECGESNVTTVFPGNESKPLVVEPELEKNTTVTPPPEPPVTPPNPQPVVEPAPVEPNNDGVGTTVIKTGTENPMNFILPVVLLLGVAAIIILFMLFRNSIHHDV